MRHWDLNSREHLRDFIGRVNRIRRDNPALQLNANLRFHPVDNGELIFFSKATEDLSNVILVVVNLDPHHTQSGWVQVPIEELGLSQHDPYQVHDLISDARYLWHGSGNFVMLDPQVCPAHILRLRRKVGSEQDFDYYM